MPDLDGALDRLASDFGLDGMQTGLSALGMAPGIGIVADLANAGISALRGNMGDAALNLSAAIPVAGQFFVAARATKNAKNAYSVAYSTHLAKSSFIGSRPRHFQEANENLLKAIETDAGFARMMQHLGVSIGRTPTGLAPRRPPSGWTWHHETGPGSMMLVPRGQHTVGSDFWKALHPGGKGGYSIWGKK